MVISATVTVVLELLSPLVAVPSVIYDKGRLYIVIIYKNAAFSKQMHHDAAVFTYVSLGVTACPKDILVSL